MSTEGPLYKDLGPNYQCLNPAHPYSQEIAKSIRTYTKKFSPKDVPQFVDLASICENPKVFKTVVDVLVARYRAFSKPVTHIAGYESRGFLLAAPVAIALGVPCLMLRKCAKNCGVLVVSDELHKEYTEAVAETMTLRVGCVKEGDNVVLLDDLMATGGTAVTGFQLVMGLGASVAEFATITELKGLQGVANIRGKEGGKYVDIPLFSMIDEESITVANNSDPKDYKEESRVIHLKRAEEVRRTYNLT